MATGGGNESKTVTGSDSFLFMSYLDEVEDRVEDLRRRALDLSQERESLLAVLLQLKHDRLTCSVTQGEDKGLGLHPFPSRQRSHLMYITRF